MFALTDRAPFYPNACVKCKGITGPFVDTTIDFNRPIGRIYVCIPCLLEMAALAGCARPEEVDEWMVEGAEKDRHIAELTEQVLHEQENKLVSLADVKAMFAEPATATASVGVGHYSQSTFLPPATAVTTAQEPPPAPAPAIDPAFREIVSDGLCSRTRSDGTPCRAKALPGKDHCLGHSPKKAA